MAGATSIQVYGRDGSTDIILVGQPFEKFGNFKLAFDAEGKAYRLDTYGSHKWRAYPEGNRDPEPVEPRPLSFETGDGLYEVAVFLDHDDDRQIGFARVKVIAYDAMGHKVFADADGMEYTQRKEGGVVPA